MPLLVTVPAPARRHVRGQLTLALRGVPGCGTTSDPETGPIPAQRPAPSAPGHPVGPRRGGRTTSRPGHPRPHDNRPPSKPGGRPAGKRRRTVAAVPDQSQRPRRHRPDLALPRHWTVDFEVLEGVNAGKVKLSSPQARGWSKVIRPHPDAVKEAITEARIYVAEQGHAVFRGSRTALDQLTEWDDPTEPPRPKVADADELARRVKRKTAISYAPDAVCRPDQASPESWSADPPEWVKGVLVRPWRSPNGRRWVAESVIEPLLEKRARLGLPLTYEEQCGEPAPVETTPERRLVVVG